jgi:hypothetical protein
MRAAATQSLHALAFKIPSGWRAQARSTGTSGPGRRAAHIRPRRPALPLRIRSTMTPSRVAAVEPARTVDASSDAVHSGTSACVDGRRPTGLSAGPPELLIGPAPPPAGSAQAPRETGKVNPPRRRPAAARATLADACRPPEASLRPAGALAGAPACRKRSRAGVMGSGSVVIRSLSRSPRVGRRGSTTPLEVARVMFHDPQIRAGLKRSGRFVGPRRAGQGAPRSTPHGRAGARLSGWSRRTRHAGDFLGRILVPPRAFWVGLCVKKPGPPQKP